MASLVIQTGGLGGGRMECDGRGHAWVVPEFQRLGCLERTPCGPCLDPERCKVLAQLVTARLQAEEAAQAKAAAAEAERRAKAQAIAEAKRIAAAEREAAQAKGE